MVRWFRCRIKVKDQSRAREVVDDGRVGVGVECAGAGVVTGPNMRDATEGRTIVPSCRRRQ
jgi:hypothetical protein